MTKQLKLVEPEGSKGPYELPEGWKWVKLGDVCEINYGKGKPVRVRKKGRIPVYGSSGIIGYNNTSLIKHPTIVMGRKGSVSEIHLSKVECWPIDTTYYLNSLREDVYLEFLFRFLKTKELKRLDLSTTIPSIRREDLYNLKIPLPPLEDQKRIVTNIERAFAKVNRAEKFLEESGKAIDKIMPAAIKQAIPTEEPLPEGWKWVKLEDIAMTTSGGTPSRAKKEYYGGGIPWIKSGELEDLPIVKSEETINEEGLKNSSAKIFPKDTLLIALYGATVGRLGVLEIDAATNQAVCAIFENKSKLFRDYLWYFLLNLRKELVAKSFGGAQPNISQTFLRDMQIPLPSLEEQKQIVSHLNTVSERVDKSKTLHGEARERVERIKASLLSKAFKGEI